MKHAAEELYNPINLVSGGIQSGSLDMVKGCAHELRVSA